MKVVRTSEVPWTQAMDHGKFAGRRKALGGERLSCGLWERVGSSTRGLCVR
jgi:hypothetical protein